MTDAVKKVRSLLWKPGALAIILLIGWSAAVFGFTVWERAPFFGHAWDGIEGAMTAGSSMAASQWFDEGALHLRFAMYWEPASVEYPTPETRTPYISFPPGALLPVFFLARILHHEPTVPFVMAYNLATHFLTALLLGLIAYLAARRWKLGVFPSLVFALPPPLLYLTLPGAYFEHQMGYFSDQAVMLPYVLFLPLEMLLAYEENPFHRRWWGAAQAVVMFWGALTDWLFLLLILCAYIARAFSGQMGRKPRDFVVKSLAFGTPAFVAMLLFFLQLYHLNAIPALYGRFVERTETVSKGIHINAGAQQFSSAGLFSFTIDNRFWNDFIPHAYGNIGRVLLLACAVKVMLDIVIGAIRHVRKRALRYPPGVLSLVVLVLLPSLLYYHALKAHCSFFLHFFTTLKFALPLSLLPFTLFPLRLMGALVKAFPSKPRLQDILSVFLGVVALLSAMAYSYSLGSERSTLYSVRTRESEQIASFIRENTAYEDIVFSRRYELPHHFNGVSGKQTHLVYNAKDMYAITARAQRPFVVDLFQEKPDSYDGAPEWAALAARAFDVREKNGLRLLKIREEDYRNVIKAANRP